MAWVVIYWSNFAMSDKRDESSKNKTLSLKLGSKPILSPKKNIEAGKTVIVEKKKS